MADGAGDPHSSGAVGRVESAPRLENTEELALVVWVGVRTGDLTSPLLPAALGDLAPQYWRALPGRGDEENWQADQPSSHLGSEPGLS